MEIISRTESFCPSCQCLHPATYQQLGDDVFFVVGCPRQEFRSRVSGDAQLFRKYRDKCTFDFRSPAPFAGYRHTNLFEITKDCNYRCRFCYTDANAGQSGGHRSVEEILQLANLIKSEGGYAITLTGGEPTLHPRLSDIVRQIRRLGLAVTMPTNGHLLGQDPALARELKKAGVSAVGIQFDTFRESVQQIHRNNRFVEQKYAAVENCVASGLRFFLLPTISAHNLGEAGKLLRYALCFAPLCAGVSFQLYYEDATEGLGADALVTREDLVRALVSSSGVRGLTVDHFWPVPRCDLLRLAVHPDCGVLTLLVLDGEQVHPLEQWMDLSGFFRELAASDGSLPFALGGARLGVQALRSVRRRQRLAWLRALTGTFLGRGRSGIFVVAVESFMSTPYQDEERARCCATASRRADGSLNQRGCFANRIRGEESNPTQDRNGQSAGS